MNLLRLVCDFFACPFITVDLEYLPVQDMSGMTTEEKAVATQLQMANHLGVPAITQKNSDFYTKLKRQ